MTIETKTRIAHWAWNISALVVVAIIVISHIPRAADWLTREKGFYGDLYKLNKVDDFRISIPIKPPREKVYIEDAQAIAIGDSFFNVNLGSPNFPALFNKQSGLKTFRANKGPEYLHEPSLFFQTTPAPQVKVLVWEEVERRIVDAYVSEQPEIQKRDIESFIPGRIRVSRMYHAYEAVRVKLFNTEPTLFLLQNAYGIRTVFEKLYTIRFHVSGDISPRTPEYSLNPPMVFYEAEVNNARKELSDEDIQHIADRIESEIKRTKEEYGIETVYIPLPSKYNIYRDLLEDNSYNELLPRLVPELQKRNVRVVDVLPLLEQEKARSSELLYYQTDTHWGPRAKQIVLDETLRVLREDGLLPLSKGSHLPSE